MMLSTSTRNLPSHHGRRNSRKSTVMLSTPKNSELSREEVNLSRNPQKVKPSESLSMDSVKLSSKTSKSPISQRSGRKTCIFSETSNRLFYCYDELRNF